MPVARAGEKTVDEKTVGAHHADAAAVFARRRGIVAQLVALGAQRELHLDLLDRHVAGVGEQVVDAVEPVLRRARAVGAFIDLRAHPVLLRLGVEAGVGDRHDGGGIAGGDALGQRRGERLDDAVDDALKLAEAGGAGAREIRIEDRSLRRDDLDGPEHAVVLRDEFVELGLVEQQRAHDVVARHQQPALERHVEGGRRLARRAGEIDGQSVALHRHRHRDFQRLAPVLAVVVEPALRAVDAVGDFRDLRAQALLGIIHPVVRRAHHGGQAVTAEELCERLLALVHRRDHRLDVAAVHVGRAHVVFVELPDRLVAPPALIELDRVEQLALGENVDDIDIEARRRAADIEEMRGGRREADEPPLMEDRHRDSHIRGVRSARVGMIVDDDIALVDVAREAAHEAADVEGQGADVHRRVLAFAQLASLDVENAAAQILGFAHDARIGHAVEHMRHLRRYGVERAAEHAQRDGIELRVRKAQDAGPCLFAPVQRLAGAGLEERARLMRQISARRRRDEGARADAQHALGRAAAL